MESIISYRERAPFPEGRSNPEPALPGIVDSILKDAAAISSFARRPGAGDRAATAFVLAFFFCTLWFFPRIGKWPLLGALLGLLAFRLGLLLAAASVSSGFASIVAGYFPASVGRWLPHATLGIAGALVLVADLMSALARRGRQGSAA